VVVTYIITELKELFNFLAHDPLSRLLAFFPIDKTRPWLSKVLN
jgi:hypothetical protein